ncbi:MAG: hypothetical protein M1365_08730 [Actinobacteria bacterium]|nr:hypothetical protein [Actinomycetota bacterium]
MRNVEFGKAIDYSKNILSHTFGVAGYKERKAEILNCGASSSIPLKLDAGFEALVTFISPATRQIFLKYDDFSKKHFAPKLIASMLGDISSDAGAYVLMSHGGAAEGIGLKLAYNAAVVVTPDVIRSMKDTFGKLKGQPPTAALI